MVGHTSMIGLGDTNIFCVQLLQSDGHTIITNISRPGVCHI